MKFFDYLKRLGDKIPDFPLRFYSVEERTVKKASVANRLVSLVAFFIVIFPITIEQPDNKTKVVVGLLFFISGTIFRFIYLSKPTNFAENASENNMEIAILWLYVAFSMFVALFLCMVLGVLGAIDFRLA